MERTVACTAYLAAEGFLDPLREELGDAVVAEHGRLLVTAQAPRPAAWAQNVWLDAREIAIDSIADGARKLRALGRDWTLLSLLHHRRAALLQEQLPRLRHAPHPFPCALPAAHPGAWTLLEPGRILAAARCTSPFPHGEVEFVEDKTGPPNRAYLKLWEALTLLGAHPDAGERCLDLGASPGGWSWALARLGARVTAVDKAPVDPAVEALPNVSVRLESAFGLAPEPVDWLFCDVACYPRRLLALVERWLDHARRMVCTIKFQGPTDHDAARAFAAIPGSRLLHLHHNKHELTWLRPALGQA
ncbi:MAG: SAM-dependent methyltransferase [Planctomycetaceae bacterium]